MWVIIISKHKVVTGENGLAFVTGERPGLNCLIHSRCTAKDSTRIRNWEGGVSQCNTTF